MIIKKYWIYYLSLIVIVSNCLMVNATPIDTMSSAGNNPTSTFIPVQIQNVINYSVEIQLEELFTTLMNNELNFYVIVSFGSNSSGLYDAMVIFGNSSGTSFVEYAFSSDIRTEPLTFVIGDINMIQEYGKLIQLTFSEYAVYKKYPVVVSAISLFSTDNLVQFETDLPMNMNNLFYAYFTLNEFQGSITTSSLANSSLSSTSSLSKTSIGYSSMVFLLILPLLFLFIKKRKL